MALMCAALLLGRHNAGAQTKMEPAMSLVQSKADEHASHFLEDPFVTKYRQKFFAVFHGDTSKFEEGMSELDAMLAKNPGDARALVWHGNGLMVRGGLLKFKGKSAEGRQLLLDSKKELDRAVSLDPDDVNIIAMRAVTLNIEGKYWPAADLPPNCFETIISDLEKARNIINPARFKLLSVHARGEILTELAFAYDKTGKHDKARPLWQEAKDTLAGSAYATQAETALKKYADSDPSDSVTGR